jgi:hypothetical protein
LCCVGGWMGGGRGAICPLHSFDRVESVTSIFSYQNHSPTHTSNPPQAVKAPSELVLAVLARLKHCGVEILVAPFEADAQVRDGYRESLESLEWRGWWSGSGIEWIV